MRILLAYLIRRWLAVSSVIVVLLTVMLLLLVLAETASDVAAGHLPPGLFWWQLLLSLPEAMGIVVPLAVSVGLILSVGQAVMDREWVVMRSSGLSLRQLLLAVVAMGLCFALVMVAITGYLQPWSQHQQQELKAQAARSAQLWGLQPGRFVEIPGANGVAYVAAVGDEGFDLHEIFIVVNKDGRDEVLTATGGHYRQSATGERYIQLRQGQRIEIPQQGLALRSASFAGGVLEIPQQNHSAADNGLTGLALHQLLSTSVAGAHAEFSWRLAIPIAVFTLSLFALVCAAWGQGEGRGWRAVLGILVYVAYVQALNLARVRINEGVWSWVTLYWIHLVFLMTAAMLITLLARRF